MRRAKRQGVNAKAWFYAQPGFHAPSPCRGLDCGVDLKSNKWVCREGGSVDASGSGLSEKSDPVTFQYWRERAERAEAALRGARDLLVAAGLASSEVVSNIGKVIAKAEGR